MNKLFSIGNKRSSSRSDIELSHADLIEFLALRNYDVNLLSTNDYILNGNSLVTFKKHLEEFLKVWMKRINKNFTEMLDFINFVKSGSLNDDEYWISFKYLNLYNLVLMAIDENSNFFIYDITLKSDLEMKLLKSIKEQGVNSFFAYQKCTEEIQDTYRELTQRGFIFINRHELSITLSFKAQHLLIA